MDPTESGVLGLRLVTLRARLLKKHPFFGRLLLNLSFCFDSCGTAFTDMERIVFDPVFAKALSDRELEFVLLHEVYHCALKHCLRGRELNPVAYNVACDIVVNSLIMELLDCKEFLIDQKPVMHLCPNGQEGRHFTAEQVYKMLMEDPPESGAQSGPDCHDGWGKLDEEHLSPQWDEKLQEACKKAGTMPLSLQRRLEEIRYTPRTNWRQLLHHYLQMDQSDYTFEHPDRRYQGDFFLPSFWEDLWGAKLEKLWFFVDTSGSVSDRALALAFKEVQSAIEQIGKLSGWISFFDVYPTEPRAFDSVESLKKLRPRGGGGTNFYSIFEVVKVAEETPVILVIITDGYANFPPEETAMGIPVIWIIVGSDVQPPWGRTVYMKGELE